MLIGTQKMAGGKGGLVENSGMRFCILDLNVSFESFSIGFPFCSLPFYRGRTCNQICCQCMLLIDLQGRLLTGSVELLVANRKL